MLDTLTCGVQNVLVTAKGMTRLNPASRLKDGVSVTSGQVEPYRHAWEASNAAAMDGAGPLLVVLGDSAAQGIGASSPFRGWVGQVVDRLRAADERSWRVVNFSVSGARARDVLDVQLPRLYRFGQPVSLVVCAIGGNDMYRTPSWLVREHFMRLVRSLPPPQMLGPDQQTVLTNLPQGLGRRRARIAGDIVAEQAPARHIEVADLWATTGPPWQGKYAEDFFHPNDRGYSCWADAISPAIQRSVSRRAGA